MAIGKLIARVKSILLSPNREWPVIAAEPASVKSLYTGYIMVLAAIPAVFGFVKGSLIGHSMFGVTIRTPIPAGLASAVVGYVLGLVLLYVVALIVNALAPTFGGRKDQVQALKAVGYAWTAAWVAAIATIIPWLGWLVVLAGGIYSIYLLYLGLPHTMKCPREKAVGYTVVTVIIAVVLSWVLALVIAGITGLAGLTSAAAGGNGFTGGSAEVTFDEDSDLGRLAALGQRMQAAAEAGATASENGGTDSGDSGQASSDSAAAGNDPQAQAEAMGAMMGAMFGGEDGKVADSLSPDQLKAFLPESLGGLQRERLSANRQSGMGMQVTEASATYVNADRSQRIDINLTDMPAMGGLMGMAGAFGTESESQSANGYEKTYVRDGRRIHEKWNHQASRGEYSIVVGDRFQVEAEGQAGSMDQLKGIVGSLDLAGLAAMRDAGAGQQ